MRVNTVLLRRVSGDENENHVQTANALLHRDDLLRWAQTVLGHAPLTVAAAIQPPQAAVTLTAASVATGAKPGAFKAAAVSVSVTATAAKAATVSTDVSAAGSAASGAAPAVESKDAQTAICLPRPIARMLEVGA
jgi:hypothetical protein